MSQPRSEIAVYNNQPQLRLPASEIEAVPPGELVATERMYLGTEISQGQYGVAAFGLVIARPESRPFYYMVEEGPAGSYDHHYRYDNPEREAWKARDPLSYSHHFDTANGFAVLRTVVTPVSIREKLSKDRFLGPAVIDKSCHEDTIDPKLFEEEYNLGIRGCIGDDACDELHVVRGRILRRLAELHGEEFALIRQFPSWHSYRMYATVIGALTTGNRATVANFDQVLTLLGGELRPLPIFEQAGRLVVESQAVLPEYTAPTEE